MNLQRAYRLGFLALATLVVSIGSCGPKTPVEIELKSINFTPLATGRLVDVFRSVEGLESAARLIEQGYISVEGEERVVEGIKSLRSAINQRCEEEVAEHTERVDIVFEIRNPGRDVFVVADLQLWHQLYSKGGKEENISKEVKFSAVPMFRVKAGESITVTAHLPMDTKRLLDMQVKSVWSWEKTKGSLGWFRIRVVLADGTKKWVKFRKVYSYEMGEVKETLLFD